MLSINKLRFYVLIKKADFIGWRPPPNDDDGFMNKGGPNYVCILRETAKMCVVLDAAAIFERRRPIL